MILYKHDVDDKTTEIMTNILKSYGVRYQVKNTTINTNVISYDAPYSFIDILNNETKKQLLKLKRAKEKVKQLENCFEIDINEFKVEGKKVLYPTEEKIKVKRKKLTDSEIMKKYSTPDYQEIIKQAKELGVDQDILPTILRNQKKFEKLISSEWKWIISASFHNEKYLLIPLRHFSRKLRMHLIRMDRIKINENTIIAINQNGFIPIEDM